MNSIIKLPRIEDVVVTKMEEAGEKMYIHAEMPVQPHTCPLCQSRTEKVHDYRIHKIKHLKIFERQTLLFYRRRRYACQCVKKFAESAPFVKRYQRLSIELNQANKIRSIKNLQGNS